MKLRDALEHEVAVIGEIILKRVGYGVLCRLRDCMSGNPVDTIGTRVQTPVEQAVERATAGRAAHAAARGVPR